MSCECDIGANDMMSLCAFSFINDSIRSNMVPAQEDQLNQMGTDIIQFSNDINKIKRSNMKKNISVFNDLFQ